MAGGSAFRARAGLLACLCGAYRRDEDEPETHAVASPVRLAVGFGLAVLSQAMTISVLPVAGALFAPRPALAPWPFAALLIGAGLASFPAALLKDRFGRRAAFALGASLGIAGGALTAWATAVASFPALLLGALWLGCAQGFGLFYRHETAASPAGAGGVALVFLGGAAAGLLAPSLMSAASAATAPNLFAGAFLAAALVHVLAFALALALPPRFEPEAGAGAGKGPRALGTVALAMAAGAAAWFAMSRVMVDAPTGLVACGVGVSGVAALVSWHVLAMYAPGLFVGQITAALGQRSVMLAGAAMVVAAALTPIGGAVDGAVVLVLAGTGWGLATAGATLALARSGTTRLGLAVHDALLFAAALAGALLRWS